MKPVRRWRLHYRPGGNTEGGNQAKTVLMGSRESQWDSQQRHRQQDNRRIRWGLDESQVSGLTTWVNCEALKLVKLKGVPILGEEFGQSGGEEPQTLGGTSVWIARGTYSALSGPSPESDWLCTYHSHRSENKQHLLWSKYYTGDAKIRANVKDAREQKRPGIESKNLYH